MCEFKITPDVIEVYEPSLCNSKPELGSALPATAGVSTLRNLPQSRLPGIFKDIMKNYNIKIC
jgi:hypothetical protein